MASKAENLVFIVDDDPMYCTGMQHFLETNKNIAEPLTLRSYHTGEECMDNIGDKPAIVLLDFQLEVGNPQAKNGLQYLRKIKRMEPDTEVVMVSAQESLEIAVDAMSYGAFYYVIKNEGAHLRTQFIINKILKERKTARELRNQKRITLVFGIIAAIAVLGIVTLNILYPGLMDMK